MDLVYIIIASQEYDRANHQFLWKEIAKQSQAEVFVINIPADYLVSLIKRKSFRIKESKAGSVKVNDNLRVLRPLFWVRPDILPEFFYGRVCKAFWKQIKAEVSDLQSKKIRVICYDPMWVRILSNSKPNMKIAYYLYDELRYNGHDNSIDKKAYRLDDFACRHSDVILAMSNAIADARKDYNANIIVIGNGAVLPNEGSEHIRVFKDSIAFVGNFRNWIDEELLEGLITKRQDVLFVIAGPIEDGMKKFFEQLLNEYENVVYYGRVAKSKMPDLYKRFNGIIIPYKSNGFIKATRPIKIVESVLAGTPVVTVPVDGYKETSFIRFASTLDDFSEQIDYILTHPIDYKSEEYINFTNDNTWSSKAGVIIEALS